MARKYPTKRFTVNVKMRCCYSPQLYNQCNNVATVIKAFKSLDGVSVLAYCESCYRDYLAREKERRKSGYC